MYISLKDPTTYIVGGLESLPPRKRYRLQIILMSLKDVAVEELSDSLIFRYAAPDPFHAKELTESLKTVTESVVLADEISAQLAQVEKEEAEKEATISEALAAKSGGSNQSEGYNSFKRFCATNLAITLREYQCKSAYLLCLGKGGFDFSVPGAGKTIIAYTAYAFLKNANTVNRCFVIGPLSSYNAWVDEYRTCFGESPDFICLATAEKSFCKDYLCASAKYHHEITFINIDKIRLLKSEITAFLTAAPTLLIIDEAHKIKSPGAKATQAAFSFSSFASVRILLTGTPMPNGYEDLHALMHVFSPKSSILPFGYAKLKAMTKKGASEAELSRLKKSIAPYYSRISKRYLIDAGELIPADSSIIYSDMDDNQSILYNRLDSFCHKTQDDIDEDLLFAFKKAVLIRKMQISANPMLLKKPIAASMDELYLQLAADDLSEEKLATADAKIMSLFSGSEIKKIVNQYSSMQKTTPKNDKAINLAKSLVEKGEKVLIWDVFVQNMDYLYNQMISLFPGQVEMINGSVSMVDRQLAIERFRQGNSMVLIANPATLAESISLHRVCQHAVYVNRNFNCGQYIQSKDRIHRINMPSGTTAHYYLLMNRDCIDESINERLSEKELRMLAILDSEEIVVGGSEMDDTDTMSNQDVELCFDRK